MGREARTDSAVALALRILAAAAMGTIGFYISVAYGYLISDLGVSSAETIQSMFPPGEYLVAADAAVTSAMAYLVVHKGGLYRAITDAGLAGWIVLLPVAIVALAIVRAIAIDVIYFPLHFQAEWSPMNYAFLITNPFQGTAYLLDAILLFAVSVVLTRVSATV